MFNDKIKLYKNLNTTINIKIRDRDRVTKTPHQVILSILDSNKVEMLQTYLDFVEDGKFFKIVVSPGLIAGFNSANDYFFTIYGVDEDDNTFPLYVDHDHNIHGSLWIIESKTPTFTEVYNSITEVNLVPTAQQYSYDMAMEGHTFNKLYRINAEDHTHLYKQTDTINVDGKTIEIAVVDTNQTPSPKTVYLLAHANRNFPISTDSQNHWNIVQILPEVYEKVVIDGLKTGLYMFAIGSNSDMSTVHIERKYIK